MPADDFAEYLARDPFEEPAAPREPPPSTRFEQDRLSSNRLKLVMDIFPGARWVSHEDIRFMRMAGRPVAGQDIRTDQRRESRP
jgi:hypothetical protein